MKRPITAMLAAMQLTMRLAACLAAVCLACTACAGVGGAGSSAGGSTGTQAAADGGSGEAISRDIFLLDTFCQLTICEGGSRASMEAAMDAAMDALNRYDALLDYSKEDSDIYRINHRTTDRVEIEQDTADLLKICADMREMSGGALEPAIRPVTLLWDFKEKKTVPPAAELEEALSRVAGGAWHIEGATADAGETAESDADANADANAAAGGKAVFVAEDSRVQIDVGAVAKGFIADRVKELILQHGVSSAIINLGGNVLCIGEKPDHRPFKIAIRDPRDDKGYGQVLELKDISAVTAGIYERYFEQDGVTYHHILDPATGMPVQNDLLSVTVTGPSSAICDALCTSIFVLGEEAGSAFLEEYNDKYSAGEGAEYAVYFLKR